MPRRNVTRRKANEHEIIDTHMKLFSLTVFLVKEITYIKETSSFYLVLLYFISVVVEVSITEDGKLCVVLRQRPRSILSIHIQ